MTTLSIYGLCLLGALGLFLLMRPVGDGPRSGGIRGLGGVLGLAAVVFLVISITREAVGPDRTPGLFFSLFGLVSVVSAAQMITTRRPVYAALHFVLVVIASAGLFLLLEAEFMAFALIIVYAGAILITYMFVLMLAQQAPDAASEEAQPEYDRFSREPAAGAIVGFVLLSVLTQTIFDADGGTMDRRPALDPPAAMVASWGRLLEMPRQLAEAVEAERPGMIPVTGEAGESPLTLHLGVRAVLEGDLSWDEVADRLPAGVSIDEVLDPERDGENVRTVAMLQIDGGAAGLDSGAILDAPATVEPLARGVLAGGTLPVADAGRSSFVVSVDADVAAVAAEGGEPELVRLPGDARPDNIQDVGLALITRFPASLEIAGVILLMAMFGAVLLARRQIEIGEDEKRAAAGLRPLGHYDEGDDGTDEAATAAGGSA